MSAPSLLRSLSNQRYENDEPRQYDINIELGGMKSDTAAPAPTYQSKGAREVAGPDEPDTFRLVPSNKAPITFVGDSSWKRKIFNCWPYALVFVTFFLLGYLGYHIFMKCLKMEPDLTWWW